MSERQPCFSKEPQSLISLNEACGMLSISPATAKNWIKLGKLTPSGENMQFDINYIEGLRLEIKLGKNLRLKSRRNKTAVGGKALYKDYIHNKRNLVAAQKLLALDGMLSEERMRILLADSAVRLYCQSRNRASIGLREFLAAEPCNDVFRLLVRDLLKTDNVNDDFISEISDFSEQIAFDPTEDTLGFIYISLTGMQKRKSSGTYYTPTRIVRRLLESLGHVMDFEGKAFLDPCCGTGNFLICLINMGASVHNIFGRDIDEISVQITRINVFLLSENISADELYSHFAVEDSLKAEITDRYDAVIGNPPWGYEFSEEDRRYLSAKYKTAAGSGIESFDLFIEKGISLLKDNGALAYVLPKTLLTAAAHLETRRIIMNSCSLKFAAYLGNAFKGIQCPAVILGAVKDCRKEIKGCSVWTKMREFTINQSRYFGDNITLSLDVTDEENDCLNKISSADNAVYLRNNAKFALGIVTGGNGDCLSAEKRAGYEPILRGSDISRYKIKPAGSYILFEPSKFQQSAPEEIYRAPEKLLYRFIGEAPVFAYDDAGTLSLNSCNILIPQIEGLHIKYILAILNSSVTAFFLQKTFNSVKLLRSHIEAVPIPFASQDIQERITERVNRIMSIDGGIGDMYEALDDDIMGLYRLSPEHIKTIKSAVQGRNSGEGRNKRSPT